MQYIYRCTNNSIDSLSRAVSNRFFNKLRKSTQILGLFESLLFCTRETRYNICTRVRSFCQGRLKKLCSDLFIPHTFSSTQLFTAHFCSSDYEFLPEPNTLSLLDLTSACVCLLVFLKSELHPCYIAKQNQAHRYFHPTLHFAC